jgi:hypothetical protein
MTKYTKETKQAQLKGTFAGKPVSEVDLDKPLESFLELFSPTGNLLASTVRWNLDFAFGPAKEYLEFAKENVFADDLSQDETIHIRREASEAYVMDQILAVFKKENFKAQFYTLVISVTPDDEDKEVRFDFEVDDWKDMTWALWENESAKNYIRFSARKVFPGESIWDTMRQPRRNPYMFGVAI